MLKHLHTQTTDWQHSNLAPFSIQSVNKLVPNTTPLVLHRRI